MKTTDHATDHACGVSLIEQLKSIPLESRDWIKDEKTSGLQNIPYGKYCQEAAEALQKAEADVERLKAIIEKGDFIPDGFYHNRSFEAGVEQAKWSAQDEYFNKYKKEMGLLDELYGHQKEELAASKAEVERLKVINADMGNFLEKIIENSRQLECELDESNADLMRTQIEMQLEIDRSKAEVERLKELIIKAAELGDKRSDTFKSRAEKAEASLIKINEELCQAGLREYGN